MDWLYYQVHVDRYADTQPVLTAIARRCAGSASLPWFYLRYLDASGLHLRLRWRGTADELDRVAGAVERFLAPAGDGAELPVRAVAPALYEPEIDKWGGLDGVRAAEDVFVVSTLTCLTLLEQVGWTARPVAAAVAMRAAVDLLAEPARESFLRSYAWYWSGGPGGAGPAGGALSTRPSPSPRPSVARRRGAELAPRIVPGMTRLAGAESVRAYREALAAQLTRSTTGPRTPGHQVFHHIHLTNNRLGIAPHQEAVLAEALLSAGTPERGGSR